MPQLGGGVARSDLEPEVLHADGIAVLLRARLDELGCDFPVYRDGRIPATPSYPYYVVWGSAGTPYAPADRLAGYGGEVTSTHQITAAGLSVDDVIGAVGRARFALHRRRPVVPGRRGGELTHDGTPGRPVPDPQREAGGQQVLALPMFFRLTTSPKRV
ncbi:MAG TPA: hypothetical protein VF657_01950 [Actinoplanes sp.]|jgi:hypothetical protein